MTSRIVHLITLTALSTLLPACKTMEYADDVVHTENGRIYVENVGFEGYRLSPPTGYQIVNERPPGISPILWQMNHNLQDMLLSSEGLNYHFHRSFLFSNGRHVVIFVPFQNKNVRQFLHIPDDIKEDYLVDWMRRAGFSIMNDLNPTMEVETNTKDQAVLKLRTETPKFGAHYGQRLLTGYLNELYLFVGYTVSTQDEAYQRDLDQFVEGLEVLR